MRTKTQRKTQVDKRGDAMDIDLSEAFAFALCGSLWEG